MGTASVPIVLLALGACAAAAGTGKQLGAATCSADAAAALVGHAAPDDATILRRTGSTVVRRIAPGDMVTQDYRIERITVAVADGRVVSATCG